jgi:hypothetical protein
MVGPFCVMDSQQLNYVFFLKEQEEQAPTGYVLRGDKINTNLCPKKGNKKVTMKT